ncbi:HXXEE domain-containing protein [Bacillus sp. T3]|uniref:HXXEE domain-containing protein n=1 Tax=Bacillus sp. T3 TaxID=467262 RepID=UPI002981B542|nr:HXXEE domain-containing protein [Bacillus sp. T3]
MNNSKKIYFSKFTMLLKLFPPLYLIHDMEEILTVEKFLNVHSNIIPFRVTTIEFSIAFTLLWIIGSIGCFKALKNKQFIGMKPTTYLSFLVPGILLANGIGHLLQFIFFRAYVPGIITSILILFPYSFITAKFLIAERVLTMKKLYIYLLIGFVLQAPLAFFALFIAKFIF